MRAKALQKRARASQEFVICQVLSSGRLTCPLVSQGVINGMRVADKWALTTAMSRAIRTKRYQKLSRSTQETEIVKSFRPGVMPTREAAERT
jgi:hypothetical protein